MTGRATPITADEGLNLLAQACRRADSPPIAGPVLLAVSGGPDSMAMLWLAARSRIDLGRLGIEFQIATVDHGLREAARLEAEAVATVCGTLKLPHRILRWEGAKPHSNLQSAARRERYRLLEGAAAACGASAIVTAHHQDDQIETHDLARERRSGDRGLAGMRARRELAPGLDLLRPFLDVPADRMRATAEASSLPFFDDPSNGDARYGRVRMRLALAGLGQQERAGRLAEIARHRAAVERTDRIVAATLTAGGATVDGYGRVRLDGGRFRDAPKDSRAELLGRILVSVAGADHPPARDALDRLGGMLAETDGGAATLGGVRAEAGETLIFSREHGRLGPPVTDFPDSEARVLFDRRFVVSLKEECASVLAGRRDARLVPLGALGLGNPAEQTMPVLVGADDRPLAVPDVLGHKMPAVSGRILIVSRVAWRLRADLPRDEMA